MTYNAPLIALVGETASGKSALALELAKRFNGEIICADSRTIYRGLDIGTAKPTPLERSQIPHHLLDVVSPNETFSAAQFQQQAKSAIKDIAARGMLPILVGGSGLYIDSVLFDYEFLPPASYEERKRLNAMSVEELQREITEKGLVLPVNHRNKRHLTRLLETNGAPANQKPLRPNTLVMQLEVTPEVLKARITKRVEAMLEDGFIEEAQAQAKKYGWEAPGLQAPGYKAVRNYLLGAQSLAAAKRQFVLNDLHLAKRQRTWFRRNKSIHRICNEEAAVELITTHLNKSLSS